MFCHLTWHFFSCINNLTDKILIKFKSGSLMSEYDVNYVKPLSNSVTLNLSRKRWKIKLENWHPEVAAHSQATTEQLCSLIFSVGGALILLPLKGVNYSTIYWKMASHLLGLQIQTFRHEDPATPLLSRLKVSPRPPLKLPAHQIHSPVTIYPSKLPPKSRPFSLSVDSSLPSSNPPASKEEAILQAKTCLSATLEKPLNNPKLAGKLKKLKQPRFRVEIPVIDDSPDSLSALATEVFQDLLIKRKVSPVKILLLWPDSEAAKKAFESIPSGKIMVDHVDILSVLDDVDPKMLGSSDVAVFLSPKSSQLAVIKTVTEALYPKPVVLFNPRWAFEEEESFGEMSAFVGSFEVIYSFMGLEVRGILSRRKGVVFKCVRDGVLSGEWWAVLVEEEGGELKVISRFKSRPSIGEVENLLYNLMAINSPITKSAKFMRDLVSNITGKK